MPPTSPIVPRYVAEPPQGPNPHGRFADRLRAEFLAAAQTLEDVDEPGVLSFFPDRSWHGYTYVPVTAATESGLEIYGYVMYSVPVGGAEPTDFAAYADFTDETAERNPDWQLDLSDEVIGGWRGADGKVASMTLIWGRAIVAGGAVATAELGELTVDECDLSGDRFTLLAADDLDGRLLEVRLYSRTGDELARESLYADE
ncbi:MAG TPA: hypothetical protein VHM72_05820 [Solirubrobacteraceae bacterium]|jgi:hypothetical protein|nr:hypothetical protein [Solirubrobacteraceae bacterium]